MSAQAQAYDPSAGVGSIPAIPAETMIMRVVVSVDGEVDVMSRPIRESVEAKFHRLVDQWRKDTELFSSVTQDHAHPAYLKILVMGKSALPLILKELRDNGGNWFLALRLIADEDPVPQAHAGMVKKMREDWITWGRQRGYL